MPGAGCTILALRRRARPARQRLASANFAASQARLCWNSIWRWWRKARVEEGDGYGSLLALLPPPERRGLILIDPPFEAPDEFETAARTVREAFRKFATGIYLIWYPIKSEAAGNAFA